MTAPKAQMGAGAHLILPARFVEGRNQEVWSGTEFVTVVPEALIGQFSSLQAH